MPFIRASRFIALRLIIGNRCILYVLQVHRVKRGKDTISPSNDELPIYVLRLPLIAKHHTSRIACGDELSKYVPRLHLIEVAVS